MASRSKTRHWSSEKTKARNSRGKHRRSFLPRHLTSWITKTSETENLAPTAEGSLSMNFLLPMRMEKVMSRETKPRRSFL
nr:TPA_asm: m102.3 sORF 1 [Murid betaherpesvirus 1]DBA08048.1 TPA_asm: m102.3 sORF 1 [Murid betaherpesvirus 1]